MSTLTGATADTGADTTGTDTTGATTGAVPQYSTSELRAAAAALAAGQFSTTARRLRPTGEPEGPQAPGAHETGSAEESVPAGPAASGGPARRPASEPVPGNPTAAGTALATGTTVSMGASPLVRVRAANAGAGASTIALALADIADVTDLRTRVLDAAAPPWSGLLGATATELGAAEGWRRGRRGNGVLIDRVEEPVQTPDQVPDPRPAEGVDLTILDAGWSTRELAAAGPSAWVASAPAEVEVLVTRSHSLALSQTESALASLQEQLDDGRVLVTIVGASRWNDRDFAAAGRLLRSARDQDAVLFVPLLAPKALPGLGPEPLPKHLTSPSRRLLERITTITGR